MVEKRPLVLSVDDEPNICEMLRDILELAEYRVITAFDGSQALDLFSERHPDLVLLDIRMPGRSGMDVLQELKRRDADVPVVIVSAAGDVKTAVAAVKMGAFDYLVKPLAMDEVVASVGRALQGGRPAPLEPLAVVPLDTQRPTRRAAGYRPRPGGDPDRPPPDGPTIGEVVHLLRDGDHIRLGVSNLELVLKHTDSTSVEVTAAQPVPLEPRLEELLSALKGPAVSNGTKELPGPAPAQIDRPAVTGGSGADRPTDEEVYEGTIRLSIEPEGEIGLVVSFLRELHRRSNFRLFELVPNPRKGVEVLVGLREPSRLKDMLAQMEQVSGVADVLARRPGSALPERVLKVHLAATPPGRGGSTGRHR